MYELPAGTGGMEKKMADWKLPESYVEILREELPDIQSTGYLLRHKKSGARVMLIENVDDN